MVEEPNLKPVAAPVTVLGELRGQFDDLLDIFERAGPIPDTSYVVCGNMTLKGYQAIETVQLLFLLKLKYPERLTLLRGNYETQYFATNGFGDQCHKKYGNRNVFNYYVDAFQFLGLSAIIEGKILCIPSGLSREVNKLEEFALINRFQKDLEIDSSGGPLNDMLYSKPNDQIKGQTEIEYGPDVIAKFIVENGLDLIIRGTGGI